MTRLPKSTIWKLGFPTRPSSENWFPVPTALTFNVLTFVFVHVWFCGLKFFFLAARKLGIRYGYNEGEKKAPFAHMLNSTLCATERTMCCLMENFQTAEGFTVADKKTTFLKTFFFIFSGSGSSSSLLLQHCVFPVGARAQEGRSCRCSCQGKEMKFRQDFAFFC